MKKEVRSQESEDGRKMMTNKNDLKNCSDRMHSVDGYPWNDEG